jgi:hypothetical protein
MNNSQVAHNWANQTGSRGTGSSFYYEGPALYSYGRHFVVGLLATTSEGTRCALMNNGRYSVTTSKHQSYARGALHGLGLKVFNVTRPDTAPEDIDANRADYLARIEAAQAALMKTRKYAEMCERDLLAVLREAAEYVRLFPIKGLMYKDAHKRGRLILAKAAEAEAGTLISETDRARINAKAAATRKADKEAAERRAKAAAAERAEKMRQLDAWTAGVEGVRAPSYWSLMGAPLPTRLRLKGAAVETSRGAVVSIKAARVLWHAIKAGRDIVGAVVEGFTVTAFNGVLKIGCHTIERAEVERVGALIDQRDAEKGDK